MVPRFDVERGSLEGWDGSDADDGDTNPAMQRKLRNLVLAAFTIVMAIEALVLIVLLCVFKAPKPKRDPKKPLKTLVVLGSGGHTAEMLKVVEKLDRQRYTPRTYVAATTDTHSTRKAGELEKRMSPDGKASDVELYAIPRSREVGQSYITSVFTTLRACLYAGMLVWKEAPDVIIANGPGTCIPICAAAYILRQLHVRWCEVVYVESIARVNKLSLSGKILYHSRIADLFLVQWESLVKRYPRAVFADRVY
uniref:UDP-N-acetylglucosamine transferase subunit ALG14 n=1 Tax=Chlamydomonas leiostraca TaxID=1034604 RepID=A0A7S0RKA0_9CHLO|mmetsp:Transcript_25236/g.64125  ORF Transcript_25236/g.64125 Transcript_25236/m.64125 type:complete len:252 (+) Transcript_25236:63-818(+)